jgi:peroxiredoxin
MARRPLAAAAVALLAAGALAGCGTSWEQRCTTSAAGFIECAPGERPPPATVRGELLDGTAYDLAQHRGSVVVVNFWGSWCNPCRAEADDLEGTYQATKARGVTFLGVNIQDDRDAANAFERTRATYPSLFDPASKVALDFEVTPNATPATFVLDRQGRIAAAKRAAVTADDLRPVVERVAAEPAEG